MLDCMADGLNEELGHQREHHILLQDQAIPLDCSRLLCS